jgi:hypothetical protein
LQAIDSQTPPASPSSAELTNKDVLEMAKAGLSAEIILAKIQTSACNFDTSPSALIDLKSAGIPEAVILAMVKSPKQARLKEERAPSTPSQPAEPSQRQVKASEVQAERSDTQKPTEGRRFFVRGNNSEANYIRKKYQDAGCYTQVKDPSQAEFFLDANVVNNETTYRWSVVLSDKQGKTTWSGSGTWGNPIMKMVKETCK